MDLTCLHRTTFSARSFALALLTGTVLSIGGVIAPALAYAQQGVSYDIAAGPLPAVLNQFARQAHVELVYDAPLTQNASSTGLKGSFGAAEGLSRILAGTGLTYRQTGPNGFTLERAPTADAGAVQLGPVRVEGNSGDASQATLAEQRASESPTGPGRGYVATRSRSGSKTDTALIDTPQSISIVTRQQIEDQQPLTVAQAFRYSAGVLAEAYGGAAQYTDTFLFVRGFKPDVYLDGLHAVQRSSTDPYLLERAEIVHGPASVLYGQGVPGGTLDLVSKRPTETPLHQIEIGGGTYGRVEGSADFSGPLNDSGTLLYRLTATGHTSGTQVGHIEDKRIAVAPALTWRPDDATTLTLLASYTHDPDLGVFAALPAVGTVLPNPNGKISRSFFVGDDAFNLWRRNQASAGYLFEHKLSPIWTVRQNVRYAHLSSTEEHLYTLGLAADQHTISRYAYYDINKRDSLDIDNQIEADFATGPITHKLLAGLDYQYQRRAEQYSVRLAPGIDYLAPNNDILATSPLAPAALTTPTTRQDQVGVYAQDQISVDRLSILLGIRHDNAATRVTDTIAHTSTRMADQATTWRAGATYRFDNGIAPYASYATSFLPQAGTGFGGTAFRPTKGRQYEVGVKYQPTHLDAFITASLFDVRQTNVLTPDPLHTNFNVQTGAIRSRGAEIEAHANLTPDINLIASYSYLDNVVTRANDTTVGMHPVAIPNNLASLWVNYTAHSGPVSGLGLSAGARYVGRTFGTATNLWGIAGYTNASSRLPDFVLFDAAIRYDFARRWRLSVNVANLADKTYVSSCLSATTCYYGAGRNVLAALGYSW